MRHKNVSYPKHQITVIQYDLDINFKAFRFAINTITIVILAIASSIGSRSQQFQDFIYSYFINLFLLPLLLIFYYAFSYDCEYSKEAQKNKMLKFMEKTKYICKNMLNSLYIDVNGKRRLIRGTIGFIAIVFFVINVIAFKINPIIRILSGMS